MPPPFQGAHGAQRGCDGIHVCNPLCVFVGVIEAPVCRTLYVAYLGKALVAGVLDLFWHTQFDGVIYIVKCVCQKKTKTLSAHLNQAIVRHIDDSAQVECVVERLLEHISCTLGADGVVVPYGVHT